MKCGVPQGSVLGPLLFIIYTNDLSSCLKNTKAIQFADDTTLYMSHKNLHVLYTFVNQDLVSLNDWFRANKLSLNVSKTNYVLFSNKRLINDNLVLNIGNDEIGKKSFCKFLGVYIDENLDWHEHIDTCKSKLSCSLYAINKVKRLVSSECLKMMYYSLVYPHLI